MAGHSALKTRVNALMSRPSTSLMLHEKQDVDARDKRGHDVEMSCLDLAPACWLDEIRVDATDAERCIGASTEAAPDAPRRDHGASSQQAHGRRGCARAKAIAGNPCRDRAHRREHPHGERAGLCERARRL